MKKTQRELLHLRNGGAITSAFLYGPKGCCDTARASWLAPPQHPSPQVSKSAKIRWYMPSSNTAWPPQEAKDWLATPGMVAMPKLLPRW